MFKVDMNSLITRIKGRLKRSLTESKKRKDIAERESSFNTQNIPAGIVALPFNHIITIQNAHALYKSFQEMGTDCVLIDVSGGDLLEQAKTTGVYNSDFKYLVFNFEKELKNQSDAKPYRPSLPDITQFTEKCRAHYSDIKVYLSDAETFDEDHFVKTAYESFESYFETQSHKIPTRILETGSFADTLSRHWLVNFSARLEANEEDIIRAFKQAWSLNGKYIQSAIKLDKEARRFESFLRTHQFSHAVHFCGPYTLLGHIMKLSFHLAELPCTLFHDAFMTPDQMKRINQSLPNFKVPRHHADILYKGRSDQPAYDLDFESDDVTLRYPVRTWAGYDFLGIPQKVLWMTWIEYPLETVGVKNRAIFEKFNSAMAIDERTCIIGNPLIESSKAAALDEEDVRPTVLVSVAPDIFSAVRFSSTLYLTSMENYYEELKKVISIYESTADIVIALHPRLTPKNPHYRLMAELGDIATVPTGELLPHADLFVTYVGSVMNFDAEELKIPMLAFSLYDDAKNYSQNKFNFKYMQILEFETDMHDWHDKPAALIKRSDKYIPKLGSTAKNLTTFWGSCESDI